MAATIEALIEDPSTLKDVEQTAGCTLSVVQHDLEFSGRQQRAGAGCTDLPVEQRLSHITPQPRQAFLLVALEGFSEEDAAEILDIDVPALRTWSKSRAANWRLKSRPTS